MEEMTEVEYKTITSYAHMCGHDGHTVTMLIVADILNRTRSKFGIN